jgi:SAM-dependent methyltransferase
MSDSAAGGFILPLGNDRFAVDPNKVAPESIFTTGRLLSEILRFRSHAKGILLDIGCGTKPYLPVFHGLVDHHFGVDVPYTYHGYRAIDAMAPSHALPIRSASVDTVFCTEVLEHVFDPKQSWAEISRVLKPGGQALVTTPFINRFHEAPYDFWRITPWAHRRMAEQVGLEILEIRTRGGFLSVLIDIKLKGFVYAVRVLRKVFRRPKEPGRFTRGLFATIQKPLSALFGNENLKSDEMTLGLVVIARKPHEAL